MRHLLLVTVEDPHNPKSWSGTPYNMLKSLQENYERVSVLSSQVPKRSLLGTFLRLILGRKKYPLWMTNAALKAYAKRLKEAVEEKQPDAVLCISSQHLVYAGQLGRPIFMISDAPWIAYKKAYKDYEELPLLSNKYAKQEAAVAKKISGVIYPTPWACKEAEVRFGIAEDKVKLLPFGANSHCTDSDEQVLQRIGQRKLDQLNFLFIGKDWDRKGGPLALDVIKKLNENRINATLHVIGCNPVIPTDIQKNIRVHGYLSPSRPEDRLRMVNAFTQADFFLVPSRAECFGLVFAEAQSYGLPCISLNSHGIPGVVEDKETGLLFCSLAQAGQIADAIIRLIKDRPAYLEMAIAARVRFTNDLNWTTFGSRLHTLIARSAGDSNEH
jgi:glycosyltransferase involved in cell wall biosynthesis